MRWVVWLGLAGVLIAHAGQSLPEAPAPVPMFNSFTDKADLTAYKHTPAEIDLNVKNGKDAFGSALSEKMDFSDYDKIDDFELNYVLWHAVMGKDAAQPPAVRRAIAFRSMPGTKIDKK